MTEIKTILAWDCRDRDISCFMERQAVSFGR